MFDSRTLPGVIFRFRLGLYLAAYLGEESWNGLISRKKEGEKNLLMERISLGTGKRPEPRLKNFWK